MIGGEDEIVPGESVGSDESSESESSSEEEEEEDEGMGRVEDIEVPEELIVGDDEK